jgi:serine/threonine-protein phosphatase 2A regulatory subunit A
MNDNEPEVRSEAVNRLAELAEYCTGSHIVQKVLPGLKLQLTTESNQHVKGSMAHSVCKLAEKLKPEEASMYLIPMVSILLKNNSTEVVVSLIENLAPLVSILD